MNYSVFLWIFVRIYRFVLEQNGFAVVYNEHRCIRATGTKNTGLAGLKSFEITAMSRKAKQSGKELRRFVWLSG
ncbi:hypothetical protein [Paenibacillus xylanilyticus]|uniref:hypothetical protein n=1 Tax=Paenibacillus xylanilyticus TaxID=248903 RepID=UPI0039A38D5A